MARLNKTPKTLITTAGKRLSWERVRRYQDTQKPKSLALLSFRCDVCDRLCGVGTAYPVYTYLQACGLCVNALLKLRLKAGQVVDTDISTRKGGK